MSAGASADQDQAVYTGARSLLGVFHGRNVVEHDSAVLVHAIGDAFVSRDGTISKDFMPDSLHLTPKAYAMWATALVPLLK